MTMTNHPPVSDIVCLTPEIECSTPKTCSLFGCKNTGDSDNTKQAHFVAWRWKHKEEDVWHYGQLPHILQPQDGHELQGYYDVQALCLQSELATECKANERWDETYQQLADLNERNVAALKAGRKAREEACQWAEEEAKRGNEWKQRADANFNEIIRLNGLLRVAHTERNDERKAREEAEAECARLRKGLNSVKALIDESRGVTGLHMNGDEAPWDELRTGGRFEAWLLDFDAAIGEAREKAA